MDLCLSTDFHIVTGMAYSINSTVLTRIDVERREILPHVAKQGLEQRYDTWRTQPVGHFAKWARVSTDICRSSVWL